jgi:hypothetical protein
MHPWIDIINAIWNARPFKKIRPQEGHVKGRNGDVDKVYLFSPDEFQYSPP